MKRLIALLALLIAAPAAAQNTCTLPTFHFPSTAGSPYYVVRVGPPDDTLSGHATLHRALDRAAEARARDQQHEYRVRQTGEWRAEICIPSRPDSVPAPPDSTPPVPPDTTTVPPAAAVSLSAVETLTNFGRDVEVFVRDSLGDPIVGHAVRFEISGGQFGNGTCCVFNRTSTSNGRTVVGWQNYGAGDAMTVTAAAADTLRILAPDSAAPAPPPGPPTPPPAPTPPAGQLAGAELYPITGPLLAPDPTTQPYAAFNTRFLQQTVNGRVRMIEEEHWTKYRDTGVPAPHDSHHYDALLGRYTYAVRNGLPCDVDDVATICGHGARIVRDYLAWAHRANGGPGSGAHTMQPHNNTGMQGVELLYRLTGEVDALNHIHVNAMASTADPYGYRCKINPQTGQIHPNSDPRQVFVALQAFSSAHRLGIPYGRNTENTSAGFDASHGSWIGAGRWLMDCLENNWIQPDGSMPSPAHKNNEAYLFNAMTATTLFRWYASVDPDPRALQLGLLITKHLADEVERRGVRCLPYLSNAVSQSDVNGEARNLAGFYPYPFAVAFAETGETRYRDAAALAYQCTSQAYLVDVKAWNQIYSAALPQNAETPLGGVPWR